MKHAEWMTETDRADLERAGQLVTEGKKLRQQVFARLRARAFRNGSKGEVYSAV
jgi:hypothetical protein